MRVLLGAGLCLFLACFLAIDGQQATARIVGVDAQGGVEHEIDFASLDEHLSSVLHLTVHADGGSDESLDASIDPRELKTVLKALEEVVSVVKLRTSLGLAGVHELKDPAAAPLVAALSRRVPAKPQDALKLLRSIMEAVHGLLVEAGSRGGASSGGLVPELSFPLLRRATVARLTQLWLLHLRGGGAAGGSRSGSGSGSKPAGWAVAARRDVGRTLLLLFRLHRRGMQSRRAVEFLHISKAAGTSMCKLAEVSGCRAQDFSMGRTCIMRDFDDQPRWINGTHHWKLIATAAEPWGAHPYALLLYGVPRGQNRKRTCASRLKVLKKHNYDFFANEYTIYNDRTAYNITEPENDEADDDNGSEDMVADVHGAASISPPSPPSPRPPLSPLSVVFEETSERYAAFVSGLLAAEGGAVAATADGGSATAGAEAATAGASVAAFVANGGGGGIRGGGASAIASGAHLCRKFANVAVLRDPAERFVSHLTFIAQTYGTMYKWPGIAQAFAPGRTSASWWRAFSPPLFDNYMLRTLGGEAVFAMSYDDLEAGAVSYMALARAMLAQYDVILVLEADEGGHLRACNFGLGWAHVLSEFQLRNASALLKKIQEMVVLGADLRLLLPEETLLDELKQFAVRYDSQLYQYGALLAGLDDAVWRVAEEALGEPLPGFRSGQVPRCGYVRSAAEGPPARVAGVPLPAAPQAG